MGRILIVDDDATNLKLFCFLMENAGHEVFSTNDAEQCLPMMRHLRPDLVMMDVQLPVIDGLELTRMAKADPELNSIPIVAVSAYALPEDEQRALRAGCVQYITKPISASTFAETVARHLSKASSAVSE